MPNAQGACRGSITAPLVLEDSAVPGGVGVLTEGDLKAGTRESEEREKNRPSSPLEDVPPKMRDSGNDTECERERDAQAGKEVSYP